MRRLVSVIILLSAIALAFYLFVLRPGSTVAAWLDNAWNYRKQITINGTADGAQTNYQMKLTVYKSTGSDSGSNVYLGTNVNNDFSDLRFTKSDGTTLLDYWIESYTSGTSAVVWVEFGSSNGGSEPIPASPSTINYYLYYGNSGASAYGASRTAMQNTLLFADDFSTALDTSLWNDRRGTPDTSGGMLVLHGNNTGGLEDVVRSTGYSWTYNVKVRVRASTSGVAGTYVDTELGLSNTAAASGPENSGAVMAFYSNLGGLYYYLDTSNGGANSTTTMPGNWARDAWYVNEIRWINGASYLNTNDGAFTSKTDNQPTVALNPRLDQIGATATLTYVDWYFVAKYTTNEPIWGTWGGEEPQPTPTPTPTITPTPTNTPTPTPTPKFSFAVSDLQKGLVGNWKFNGNAKDSISGNHGVVTGATLTTDRKGQVNKAYSFDGSTNYIDVGSGASLSMGTGNQTIELWFKNNAAYVTPQDTLFYCGAGGSGLNRDGYFILFNSATSFQVMFTDGTTNRITSNSITTPNVYDQQWHHFVGVFNRASNFIAYIDGVLLPGTFDISSQQGDVSNSLSLRIGSTGNSLYSNGSMDDVRIYNRALSQTEVTALYEEYDGGVVVSDLQKGLLGQWKMDGNAKDSISSNHGTVTGATLTTDKKGQANKAYSFNGTSDYVNMGNVLNMITNDFSFAVWAKVPNGYIPAGWDTAFIHKHTFSNPRTGYYFFLTGALATNKGRLGLAIGTSPTWLEIQSNKTINDGLWHLLVGVADRDNSLSLYIDGVLDNSTPINNLTYDETNTTPLKIGVGSSAYLNGFIDDVRIYNRALSAAEVQALYENQ